MRRQARFSGLLVEAISLRFLDSVFTRRAIIRVAHCAEQSLVTLRRVKRRAAAADYRYLAQDARSREFMA